MPLKIVFHVIFVSLLPIVFTLVSRAKEPSKSSVRNPASQIVIDENHYEIATPDELITFLNKGIVLASFQKFCSTMVGRGDSLTVGGSLISNHESKKLCFAFANGFHVTKQVPKKNSSLQELEEAERNHTVLYEQDTQDLFKIVHPPPWVSPIGPNRPVLKYSIAVAKIGTTADIIRDELKKHAYTVDESKVRESKQYSVIYFIPNNVINKAAKATGSQSAKPAN